jgi:hypothetical protein
MSEMPLGQFAETVPPRLDDIRAGDDRGAPATATGITVDALVSMPRSSLVRICSFNVLVD